jgi:type I restriction enzyme M protein
MVAAKGDKEIGDKHEQDHRRWPTPTTASRAHQRRRLQRRRKARQGQGDGRPPDQAGSIFEGLDFGGNRAEGDDLLGDAYEYLMRHFATESGKSKGQFYTPAEVSRIMAMVIDLGKATRANQSIYDPTCGSGSLLLKAHDEAKSRTGLDLALYGQEMDNATSALARMNMVLHDCPTAEIWQDNTLSSPHFKNADGWAQDLRLRGRQFPLLEQELDQRTRPGQRPVRRFELRRPPPRTATTPSCCTSSPR